jgi:hypothetical protein
VKNNFHSSTVKILIDKKFALHLLFTLFARQPNSLGAKDRKRKNQHEGALARRMAEQAAVIRTVYDYPVAAHLCIDGIVRNIRLVRRSGSQPQGTCNQCQTSFQYVKPKASPV